MGISFNKKATVSSKKADMVISKLVNTTDFESVLYRPIDTFKWQDASRNEINKEAISHYAKKFAL